ncbi:MAG: NAD(P)-dependent oxidoreductase [Candidatus Diapherotrites archaeon]|nr:NAD(P)-dependent oxidoreductase [Candidatus Diapherotrites archaeon]
MRAIGYSGKLTLSNAKQHEKSGILAIFIDTKINRALLDRLPEVKLICCMSTGFDHVDIQECKKRGITVCNVPSYGENTVAEHTFALILNLSRKVHLALERTKRGNFSTSGLTGWDLFGRTIGIVGAGRIGWHVARIAKGFGMRILVNNPKLQESWVKDFNCRFVPLEELLKSSDVVTLHCPLIPATAHLINKKNILLMKKNAILINTARGGIVDTQALGWALGKKIIAGAGLDVLENENLVKDETQVIFQRLSPSQKDSLLAEYRMLNRSNVIITPHNAFNSREALQRILDETLANILAFQKGKPINRIV